MSKKEQNVFVIAAEKAMNEGWRPKGLDVVEEDGVKFYEITAVQIVFSLDFAKSFWGANWKTLQRQALEEFQEKQYNGLREFIRKFI